MVMLSRIACAIAAGAWGRRGTVRMPKWSLGVADFPKTAQEDFDRRAPHPDPGHQEKRPAWVKRMAVWIDQCHRQIRAFGMAYGAGHGPERRGALQELIRLNEEPPPASGRRRMSMPSGKSSTGTGGRNFVSFFGGSSLAWGTGTLP